MKVIPPITLSNTEGSFARSSTATYIDSTGAVQTALANTPRVTYDRTTKQCLGVLYDRATTNLFPFSSGNLPNLFDVYYTTLTNAYYTISFYGQLVLVNVSSTSSIDQIGVNDTTTRSTYTFLGTSSRVIGIANRYGALPYGTPIAATYVQLELGTVATSYTPYGTPRAADTFTGIAPCLTYSSVANASSTTAWVSGSAYVVGGKVYRSTTNCVYQCIKEVTASTVPAGITPETSVLLSTPYWRQLDALPWVSGTTYTYVAGVSKQVTYANRTYELIATTTVNTTLPTAASPSYWIDVGPSNRWGVFDYLRNSATNTRTQLVLSISVTANTVDTLVLVGLQNVQEAIVTVYSPSTGNTLYRSYKSVAGKASASWYDYFFTPGTKTKSAVFSNLTASSDVIISVVLNGSDIACGGIILGVSKELGTIQRDVKNEVLNFSTVARDIYGNATMVRRRNIPRTNQTLLLDKSLVNSVRQIRDDLNAVPAAWVGLEDLPDQFYFESVLIVGFYRNFTINLDNPVYATINLELEEI